VIVNGPESPLCCRTMAHACQTLPHTPHTRRRRGAYLLEHGEGRELLDEGQVELLADLVVEEVIVEGGAHGLEPVEVAPRGDVVRRVLVDRRADGLREGRVLVDLAQELVEVVQQRLGVLLLVDLGQGSGPPLHNRLHLAARYRRKGSTYAPHHICCGEECSAGT
jgi:hypothetical protein